MVLVKVVLRNQNVHFLGLVFMITLGYASQALSQCGAPPNAIVAENCQTGNPPSEWDVTTSDGGDPTIQGFATDISVNAGNTIYFKVATTAKAYSISIYRMGYYKGFGARKVETITPAASLPQIQPACLGDNTTGLTDCGNWALSAAWQVPAAATSGIYFAHLVRSDTGGDSHIVFVVRNDASASAILFKTSDETWQAYNYYGSGSLYGPGVPNFDLTARAYKVSYNRPFLTRGFEEESNTWVFGAEFPMIQWLEQNGYDVTYSTGMDAVRNGSLLKNHKLIMDSGHDEYISGPERANIQAARDAGVNLAFFSGNEMFWKTRWESSMDGSQTPNRTMVCYKETLAFAKLDPQNPPTWTGTWRDPTFSPPADGGKPENALTGTLFMVNGTGADNPGNLTIQVPAADGQMRFWRGTSVASLAPGSSYNLVKGSLGYEFDEDIDNGARPAGMFHLSTSTYTLTSDLLLDYGGTYGAGHATHNLTLYRAPSGALVFGAGTINWSWGLNANHDNPFDFENPDPDPNMQQAVVNLFADMGVQPTTLQAGLVQASASTDTIPPQSIITSPPNGSNINTGNTVTVMGTASDVGGMVAAVEVSGDEGATWHPAIGRAAWSYTWTPRTTGNVTLLSRAVDDSGNLETPTNAVTIDVAPQVCPCTIFSPASLPSIIDSRDAGAIEVGIKFRADADGSILGLRFYKSNANTGVHIGHVWSSTGTLLGTAAFSNESTSGWQQVNFTTPIQATANTTYVASYFAPSGHYSADSFAFEQAGVDDPPLHALANGVDGSNGLYFYGPSGGFPTSTFNASNYWVDIVYTSSNTYSISGTISGYGGAGAVVNLTGAETLSLNADSSGNYTFDGVINGRYMITVSNPGVTFAPPSQALTISFGVATNVNFAAKVSSPLNISGTLTGGAGATVNLTGTATATTTADSSGYYVFSGLLPSTYSVTPVESGYIFQPDAQDVVLTTSDISTVNFAAELCTCISLWPATTTPALIDSNDGQAAELGLKFRTDSAAYITGIRFYKASTNTGSHVGHIWTNTGALLATATFTGETASGWQQASLSSPIWVQANTTYVVSYFAPAGHYSADTNYFLNFGVDRPPLHALATGVDGPDGVYLYSASAAFPTNSYASTNYWIDVLYASQPHVIRGSISGSGNAGATVALTGTASAITTTDALGNYSFSGISAGTYTVTPTSPGYIFNPGSQVVTIVQSDAVDVNFAMPQVCPCNTIWAPTSIPVTVDAADPHPGEYGVKVQADRDGYVLGIRYYKAVSNTGTHTGNLWSEGNPSGSSSTTNETSTSGSGTLLATANFANESSTGWQQVLFANPVPVIANTTYIASYFAPVGHYAANSGAFAAAGVDSPPLHAIQQGIDGSNGVFSYSSASSYPTSSFGASNYWVDVIYAATGTHTLAGSVSGAGSAGTTMTLTGPVNSRNVTDAKGNYNFAGLADGVYTVVPTNSGIVFSPSAQNVIISGAHQLEINFVSRVMSYSISGQVTGAPGISVTLSGAATATTVADASGLYSFQNLANGIYLVTPSAAGFSPTPGSQSVTVSNAEVTSVNFTAQAVTYSISGNLAGGAGATVSLISSLSTTTTADLNGDYVFNNVGPGIYSLVPSRSGLVFTPTSQSAAIASGNLSGVNFLVPQACPCDTIWQPFSAPATADYGDSSAVELGTKFRADADSYVLGVRFYKAAANTGIHLAHLWSETGTLLGSATFSNESASGWQQALFSPSVPIVANTTYVTSYLAPNGHYAADLNAFTNAGIDSPPLHALVNNLDGADGVYLYTSTGGFPNQSNNQATNYWVDVIDAPTATYSITGMVSGLGGPGASVALTGPTPALVVADASGNFSFTGLANGSYTVTPSSTNFNYTPASFYPTISSAHALGLSFSSTPASFAISGSISGPGGPGASVSLAGAAVAQTNADASGNYLFSAQPNGSYSLTVLNSGYVFTPASQTVVLKGANSTAAFGSAAQTYTLSGVISGVGGAGATVTLSGTNTAVAIASSVGSYSFTSLSSGSYSVSASNRGYVMAPASQSIALGGASATANFIATSQTYSLSGTITGPGASGATIMLSGVSSAATTTNSSGAFVIAGLVNGSYVVTASNAGIVFAPAIQNVIVNGANATSSFASALQTYTISGTVSGPGAAGASMKLAGAKSTTATADGSGNYNFTGLQVGSYTLTAANPGFLFTPVAQAVNISNANVIVAFSSALPTYTVTGTLSGPGGNGATVTLAGATTSTVTASASGFYTFAGVANGPYTITPAALGYIFNPVSRPITVNKANLTSSFTSAAGTYTVSGTIAGPGAAGVTIKATGSASGSTTTSNAGIFTFIGVPTGSYTLTPARLGFTFMPASQAITVNANQVVNFTSASLTYSVSGIISGAGGPGATVSLNGSAKATATATATGIYQFNGLSSGSYSVSVANSGYVFSPTAQNFNINNASVTESFNSSPQTYTISGNISGAAATGVTISISGAASASTFTNASGGYAFTNRQSGTYTIIPSKNGFVFTPASQSVMVENADGTANFLSKAQTYSITGTISGPGASAATVALSGTSSATALTDAAGVYTFSLLANGIYLLAPRSSGRTFSPAINMTTVNSANVTGVNFSSK